MISTSLPPYNHLVWPNIFFWLSINSTISFLKRINTTTLSSFTDRLIPSVTAMKSVGNNNTDGVTDESRPVNPISVANSVTNKKNHPPTETSTEIQTDTRAKKKFPAGTLPTE